MQVMRTMEYWQRERAEMAIKLRKMMLDLIEISTFNAFDGKKVRADLESIPDCWQACMMTRDGDCGITLRDLSDGCYNVDTLYILTDRQHYQKVLKLAKTWKADHILQYRSDGQFGSDRWESGRDGYKFHHLKNEKQDVGSFLGASDSEKRVIIRLWWD